jgi:hypothetical protein
MEPPHACHWVTAWRGSAPRSIARVKARGRGERTERDRRSRAGVWTSISVQSKSVVMVAFGWRPFFGAHAALDFGQEQQGCPKLSGGS